MSEADPIFISRTIYDPARKDFVFDSADAKALPNIRAWIDTHNPVIYWYILRIDNTTDIDIFQWAVELHTHQALTITEAYVEDINRRFELKKRELDHWNDKYILSIHRPAGIPIISKGGTRRVYFKVDINCKEGLMDEYGISGSFIAQGMDPVEIKEKLFQYSCKVDEFKQIFDYNPDEASLYARKRLTSEYSLASAQAFTNSFHMIHDLVKYCHSSYLEKEELKKRLRILHSNYEKVPDIAGERILPLISDGIRELDVLVDRGKLAPRFIRLCDELVELLHMEVMVSEPQVIVDETPALSSYQAVREEEERKKQGEERLRRDEEERLQKEKEKQERQAREVVEQKKREEEERSHKEEEERLEKEREEQERQAQEEAEREKREEDERIQREEEARLQRKKEEQQRIAREGAERNKLEEQESRRREEDEKLRRQREEEKARKKIESLQKAKIERARKEREEKQRRETAEREQKAKEEKEKYTQGAAFESEPDAAKRAAQSPAGRREVKRTGAGKSSPTKFYALALILGALLVGLWLLVPGSDDISGTDDVVPTAKETPASVIASPAADKTTTNSIGMEFVLIPAGEFKMGSPSGEKGRYSDEGPVHTVTIKKAYYLGKYEVTQEQWRKVMGSNPSSFKGDDLPVEKVSWNDAQEFVRKLNEIEGTDKYRLPSEAEWEYAARAGTTTRYSFGNDESDLGKYAWYRDNSNSKTHSVGQKQPNPWGLYDMHGNVWEWVQDRWHSNYDGAPTDGSAWEEGSSSNRVLRGGSWYYYAGRCRSARRDRYDPGLRNLNVGFRLLQDP